LIGDNYYIHDKTIIKCSICPHVNIKLTVSRQQRYW